MMDHRLSPPLYTSSLSAMPCKWSLCQKYKLEGIRSTSARSGERSPPDSRASSCPATSLSKPLRPPLLKSGTCQRERPGNEPVHSRALFSCDSAAWHPLLFLQDRNRELQISVVTVVVSGFRMRRQWLSAVMTGVLVLYVLLRLPAWHINQGRWVSRFALQSYTGATPWFVGPL